MGRVAGNNRQLAPCNPPASPGITARTLGAQPPLWAICNDAVSIRIEMDRRLLARHLFLRFSLSIQAQRHSGTGDP